MGRNVRKAYSSIRQGCTYNSQKHSLFSSFSHRKKITQLSSGEWVSVRLSLPLSVVIACSCCCSRPSRPNHGRVCIQDESQPAAFAEDCFPGFMAHHSTERAEQSLHGMCQAYRTSKHLLQLNCECNFLFLPCLLKVQVLRFCYKS